MSTRPDIGCAGGTVRPGSSSEQALGIAARRVEEQRGTTRVHVRPGAL